VGAGVLAEGGLRFSCSILPGLAAVAWLAQRLQVDADDVPAGVAFDVVDFVRRPTAVRAEREALQLRPADCLPLLSPVRQVSGRMSGLVLFSHAAVTQRSRWPVLR
jgi:hypothetical protein